jgi:sugar-specific transcriptional regulator TrmB
MDEDILKLNLKNIGLSDSEAIIYITLIKNGSSSISEISQISGLHRTNIYDSIEKLKEKGFVTYLQEENKQICKAVNPEIILDYLKEKESKMTDTINELNRLRNYIKEKVSVEIFKGKQGMRSALRDILNTKKEVIGYNVSGQLRKYMPEFAEYYFREQTKYKILHKFIYISGTPKPKSKFYEIKYVTKEYVGTTITLCYEDVILNLIWEPEIVAIKTKSKELTEDYKKHFELLWKIAKP